MASRSWQSALLKSIGAPVTEANVKFLTTWQRWEGGHTNNSATWNWLNTTHGPGKPINDVGVKAFPNFATGIKSLSQTLQNGRYKNLVYWLRKGDPYNPAVQPDLETWVSGSPTGNPAYAQHILGGGTLPAQQTSAVGGASAPLPPLDMPSFDSLFGGKAPKLGHQFDYIKPFKIPKGAVSNGFGYTDPGGSLTHPTVKGNVYQLLVGVAGTQIGKPYVFGSGPDTSSFDCSDLIQWAYGQLGIHLPRTTWEQIKVGQPVQWGAFKPGDLIFSNGGEHVVMYVGNGKVIAAPHTGTVVQYQPISKFKSSFVGARRIIQ